MKQALKAKSVGEKLYQLERIHSKLIHLCKIDKVYEEKNENNEGLIIKAVGSLKNTVECFNCNRSNKTFTNYIKCIDSLLFNIHSDRKDLLFKNFCNLHGAYVKYRRKNKKKIEESCEYDYQNICMPLFILNYKIKNYKLS